MAATHFHFTAILSCFDRASHSLRNSCRELALIPIKNSNGCITKSEYKPLDMELYRLMKKQRDAKQKIPDWKYFNETLFTI
jgi:hypothetical protein